MTISRRAGSLNIILLIIGLFACLQSAFAGETGSLSFSHAKLKVLTTIAPLYSFTKNIAGDFADVENLLPRGAGPHEYSFSPADIKKIAEAHILIKNGANLETWLDNAIASADRKGLTVIDSSTGVDIENNNPHIWLSPKRAIAQALNIRNALTKADPERKKQYFDNADSYIKRLQALDRDIREEVRTWRKKEFVAFHPAFLYFAKDYGLGQAAVIQEFPEKEPSPRHIAYVIKTIKEKGMQFIFSELLSSPKVVDTIAKDLNLRVYKLDTLETGPFSPGGYEESMRKNLAVFKKALK